MPASQRLPISFEHGAIALPAWIIDPMRERLREVARPLHDAVLAECRAILPELAERVRPGDPWDPALAPLLDEIRDPLLRFHVGLVFKQLYRGSRLPDKVPEAPIRGYDVRIVAPAVNRRTRSFGPHLPWALDFGDRGLRYDAVGDRERLAHIADEPVIKAAFAMLDTIDWPPDSGGIVIRGDIGRTYPPGVVRRYGPRGAAWVS